jgi:ElaB/YqjD/DUF883 family membrane-anchored ribosome-binding protein
MKDDIADLTAVLRDLGARKVDEARDGAEDELRARREQVREHLRSARARGRETVDDLGDTMGEHPLSTLGIAFGAGFIIAKLLDLGGRR